MGESLGEAVLDLRADDKDFTSTVDNAEKRALGLEDRFKSVGKSLSGFGDKLTVGVTLPLVAAGAAAFKMAADAGEASNKFEVVMGDSADSVRASLTELQKTIPLTTGELLGLAAGTQDLLVPMGLSRKAGAKMSAQFLEMAGDIAAFNDVSPAQVLADIKSGLVGSSEPLFKYGVDTRVAALQTVALANGLIEQGESLTDVTRAQAVMIQIQNQSTDAMGAAAREADGASAATRFLFRDVKQLAEDIGVSLIPVITPMIQQVREWIAAFQALSPETQQLALKAAFLAASIGPVLAIAGRLTSGIGFLVQGFKLVQGSAVMVGFIAKAGTLATSLGGLSGVLGTVVTFLSGPVGIAIAIGAVLLAFKPFRTFLASVGQLLLRVAKGAFGGFVKVLQSLGKLLLRLASEGLKKATDGFKKFLDFISPVTDKIIALGKVIAKWMGDTLEDAAVSIDGLVTSGEALENQVKAIGGGVLKLAPTLPPLATNIAEIGDEADGSAKKIATLDEVLGKLGFTTAGAAEKEVANLIRAFESGEVPIEQMGKKVQELILKYDALGLLSPAVKRKLEDITGELEGQGEVIETEVLVALGRYDEALTRLQEQRITEWQKDWTSALRDSEDALTDLGDATIDFMMELPQSMPDTSSIMSTFTDGFTSGLPQLMGGVTAALGSLFTGGIDGALDTITGALKGVLGAAMNAVVPGLGALAGPMIDGLVSLLQGMFKKANAADHVEEFFGIALKQGMAEAIDKLAKDIGDISAAFRLLMAEVIKDAVISTEADLNRWVQRVLEILSSVDEGFISLGQAVSSMTDSFLALIPSLKATGGSALAFQSALSDIITRMGDTEAASIALQPIIEALLASGVEGTQELIAWLQSLGLEFEGLQEIINETAEVGKSAWRVWAEDAGVSFEKFEGKSKKELRAIVDAMGLSAEAGNRVFRAMLKKQEADQKAFNKTQRDKFREQADDLGLSEEDKAAFVKANVKLRRQEIRALDLAARQIRIDERKAFKKNQRIMARAAEEAAERAAKAWVQSADDTIEAWAHAQQQTVGSSSILDIEKFGSMAAMQLKDNQVEAAVSTGMAWEDQSISMDRLMSRMADASRSTSATISSSASTPAGRGMASLKGLMTRMVDEVAGLRKELRTQIPLAAGIAARHQAQTAGRKRV